MQIFFSRPKSSKCVLKMNEIHVANGQKSSQTASYYFFQLMFTCRSTIKQCMTIYSIFMYIPCILLNSAPHFLITDASSVPISTRWFSWSTYSKNLWPSTLGEVLTLNPDDLQCSMNSKQNSVSWFVHTVGIQ